MTQLYLPSQFGADRLFSQVQQTFGAFEVLPDEVILNFRNLGFAHPSGVVFLSNLTHFLRLKGVHVRYAEADVSRDAIKYLDDALFFEQHFGAKLSSLSRPRKTTQPLMQVQSDQAHGWLAFTLIPWLSECSGIQQDDLRELQTCVSELFNNIADHTAVGVGSIFAQWFPNVSKLVISIADFGPGIPDTVRRVDPELSDPEAILKAFESGFTSKSLETNQGVGLHYLQQNVVETLRGRLNVYSSCGAVSIEKVGFLLRKVPYDLLGMCPGTVFEIEFSTDLIERSPRGTEDFEW